MAEMVNDISRVVFKKGDQTGFLINIKARTQMPWDLIAEHVGVSKRCKLTSQFTDFVSSQFSQ